LRKHDGSLPCLFTFHSHHIQGISFGITANSLMRLYHKICNLTAQPVVSACIFVGIIHPLLDNRPISQFCEDKRMVVELVPVLDGAVVNLCAHSAGIDEFFWITRQLVTCTYNL